MVAFEERGRDFDDYLGMKLVVKKDTQSDSLLGLMKALEWARLRVSDWDERTGK